MNWSKVFLGLWAGYSFAGCMPANTEQAKPSEQAKVTELFGHRFRILADVDGDGLADTLTEVYHSKRLGGEMAKYVQGMSYDSLVARTYELQPVVMVDLSNGYMDTVSDSGPGFGLALLMNEGDLDGDGGDEIGYVLDNADWSSTNTYHVASWKKDRLRILFTFPIWDWQLPDLPDSQREYGLIGQIGRKVHSPTDSMPTVDLVIPLRTGAAMVVGNVGDATLDTMEVLFAEGDSVRYIRPLMEP